MTSTPPPPLPPRPDYLSAGVLGIMSAEHAGLIALRDDLAADKLRHSAEVRDILATNELGSDGWESSLFNMLDYHTRTECGTAHCLAGHLQARGVYTRRTACGNQYSLSLYSLFSPDTLNAATWDELTPRQAALAIDAFMMGAGADCWARALDQEPLAD